MIEDYNFQNESVRNKLSTTTDFNLKTFLTLTYKFPENDNTATFEEDLNETRIKTDAFEKISNPTLPPKEDEIFIEHYFISDKTFNCKKQKIFMINYKIRIDEFNDKENAPLSNEKTFLGNKTLPTIKRRRENVDNIHKKIKTVFFNSFLYNIINKALKHKNSKLYFVKFSISFVNDVKRNTNKDIINLSLLEIISNKELYNTKDLSNYYHNLKVVENKEIEENEELKEILNKTYRELFEEYINSKEFNIDEINRLKNKNMDNAYIKRYIYCSKHFIDYFSE